MSKQINFKKMTKKSVKNTLITKLVKLGFLILTTLCAVNCMHTYAKTYTLPPVIEASNFNTSDYVWQILLTPENENKTLDIKLINPSPIFSQLNQRALDIAHTIQLKDLPKEHIGAQSAYFQQYILSIRFVYGVAVKTKPDFTQATQYVRNMCKSYLTQSNFRSGLISQEKNFVSGWVKLSVDTKGMISKVDFLNQTEDKKFNKLVENSFKSMDFYPYSKNAILIKYTAMQAFKITCDPYP